MFPCAVRRSLLLLLVLPGAARAQDRPLDGLVPRATAAVKLDGKLAEWDTAFVTPVHVGHPDFADRGAQFLYLWDDDHLYLGLRCFISCTKSQQIPRAGDSVGVQQQGGASAFAALRGVCRNGPPLCGAASTAHQTVAGLQLRWTRALGPVRESWRVGTPTALADRLGVKAGEGGDGSPAAFGPVDGGILGLPPAEEGGGAEDAAGRLDPVPVAAVEADP